MTWAKIDDRFNDDPELLALPRGVRLLHIEGIVWCCRHLRDGSIPAHVLNKVTDEPDATAAVQLLVDAGLWLETDGGWEIAGFLDKLDQTSSEEVERYRAKARERQERHRRHLKDDHDLCDPKRCHALLRDPSRQKSRQATGDQRAPNRSDTDPTPREDRKEERSGASGPGSLGVAGPGASRPEIPRRPSTPLVVEVVKR